jgi:hypothetical protein
MIESLINDGQSLASTMINHAPQPADNTDEKMPEVKARVYLTLLQTT